MDLNITFNKSEILEFIKWFDEQNCQTTSEDEFHYMVDSIKMNEEQMLDYWINTNYRNE